MFKNKSKKRDESKEERKLSVQVNSSIVHQTQVVSYTRHTVCSSSTSTSVIRDNLGLEVAASLPALRQLSEVRPLPSLLRDASPFQPPERPTVNLSYPFRNFQTASPFPAKSPLNAGSCPTKINVKRTGKFYDNTNSAVPIYKTSGRKRGEVLVINNVIFKESSYREGADKDEVNICKLFSQMGFKVKSKRNLKKSDMKSEIRSFSHKSCLKSVDISVLVVMSHGTNQAIKGSYTEVFGVDDKGLDTESIFEFFTTENCPSLAKKPKIFIFQCCRGNNEAFLRADATVIKKRAYEDMLIAHSTLPGFPSLRDPTSGTWYIQTICEVFSEHAHEYDVENLLKIVDAKLSKISASSNASQTSSYENWGFKCCYFHP